MNTKLEELKQQVKETEATIKGMESDATWPDLMDRYWYIDLTCQVFKVFLAHWHAYEADLERKVGTFGIFRTEEAAREVAIKLNIEMRVKAEARRLNGDWVINYNYKGSILQCGSKYHICRSVMGGLEVKETIKIGNHLGLMYLKSQEDAESLIKSHGGDIKLMMGIA